LKIRYHECCDRNTSARHSAFPRLHKAMTVCKGPETDMLVETGSVVALFSMFILYLFGIYDRFITDRQEC